MWGIAGFWPSVAALVLVWSPRSDLCTKRPGEQEDPWREPFVWRLERVSEAL